jgi:hypothetical protein
VRCALMYWRAWPNFTVVRSACGAGLIPAQLRIHCRESHRRGPEAGRGGGARPVLHVVCRLGTGRAGWLPAVERERSAAAGRTTMIISFLGRAGHLEAPLSVPPSHQGQNTIGGL